jgi:glycosyl transferase family 87
MPSHDTSEPAGPHPSPRTPGEDGRAAPATRRTIGIGVVLLLLTGTLAIGHAIKAPCVHGDWSDGRPFTWLCHTDIIPLIGNEQLYGDRLPYLDPCEETGGTCDEYPVLTTWMMRLTASVAGPHNTRFFYANAILLWLAALWTAYLLYTVVGRRALYFALAPTLAIYATLNFDLLPVALATGGTVAYLRRRDVTSGVLLGLGAAAKLYPALLVIPFVVGRFRGREPDRGIYLIWAAVGAWVAVNLPFALAGTSGWLEFFTYNSSRPADWDSLWFIVCEQATGLGCTNTRLVNLGSLVLFVGWVTIVWTVKGRRQPGFPRWTLGFPILLIFLLTNKVYSPQYSVWLLPWFALALPNLRLFLAFEAADMAVFVTRFSWFGLLGGHHNGFAGSPLGGFEVAILVRAAVLILCVIAWVRAGEPVPRLERPPPERTDARVEVPV